MWQAFLLVVVNKTKSVSNFWHKGSENVWRWGEVMTYREKNPIVLF